MEKKVKVNKSRSNKRYITTKLAAQFLCTSSQSLAQQRYLNYGPRYIKMPGRTGKVLYDVRDLNEYLESRKVQPVNEI